MTAREVRHEPDPCRSAHWAVWPTVYPSDCNEIEPGFALSTQIICFRIQILLLFLFFSLLLENLIP